MRLLAQWLDTQKLEPPPPRTTKKAISKAATPFVIGRQFLYFSGLLRDCKRAHVFARSYLHHFVLF